MSSAPSSEDLFDEFLEDNGHETEIERWERSFNKKQCPECGGLHDESASKCNICGWHPAA